MFNMSYHVYKQYLGLPFYAILLLSSYNTSLVLYEAISLHELKIQKLVSFEINPKYIISMSQKEINFITLFNQCLSSKMAAGSLLSVWQ